MLMPWAIYAIMPLYYIHSALSFASGDILKGILWIALSSIGWFSIFWHFKMKRKYGRSE